MVFLPQTLNSTPYRVHYYKMTGYIFIVKYAGNRVRRVLGSDWTISTVVGAYTVSSGIGDDGPAVEACLSAPYDFKMNHLRQRQQEDSNGGHGWQHSHHCWWWYSKRRWYREGCDTAQSVQYCIDTIWWLWRTLNSNSFN